MKVLLDTDIASCLAKINGFDVILLSNDGHVNKKSRDLGIRVYNLEDLLSLAIEEGVIKSGDELEVLMDKIEHLDRSSIRDKDYLRRK